MRKRVRGYRSCFLPAAFLIAISAAAQSSLVPVATNVVLYACPGGLRQVIPINAATPTSFRLAFAAENWLEIYAGYAGNNPPTTPTWIVFSFSESPTAPAAPVDVTLTPTDGSAPVVIHVSWNPNPDCNPGGNGNGSVTINPAELAFYAPTTTQRLTLQTTSSSPVRFSVSTTAPWLSVASASSYSLSSSAPATLSISANPSGTPATTFSAAIIVTPAGQAPIYIPVQALGAGPTDGPGGPYAAVSQLTFHATWNGPAPPAQDLPVTGQYPDYVASATALDSGTNWLSAARGVGQDQTVSVNPTGLGVGSYQGRISLTANNTTVYSLVTLSVDNPSSTLSAAPAALSFDYSLGTPSPPSQKISIGSAAPLGAPVSFTAAATTDDGGDWVSANLPSGSTLTPASFTVSVNPAGLSIGTHRAWITLKPTGSATVQVPVVVVVRAAPGFSITPANISLQFPSGLPCDKSPNACQTMVTVSSTNGAALDFMAQITGAGWLSVTPASGTTSGSGPLALTLTHDPNIAAGTHQSTLQVTATTDPSITTTAAVTATVSPAQPGPVAFVNAASYTPAQFAPGEIVTIFGDNLGPDTPVIAQPGTNGQYPTQLGGVYVQLGEAAATLLYVSRTQVNMIVPYVMCHTSMCLHSGLGGLTPGIGGTYMTAGGPAFFVVTGASGVDPGIFTPDGSGRGQGAILNQDYGVNGPSNPAVKGSVVQVFMTGEGQTSPAGVDGRTTALSPTPPITPLPLLGVTATIGGQPAAVIFSGEAPGLVAGVLQVNVQIPANTPSGAQSIQISIGGMPSQTGVTVSVQ